MQHNDKTILNVFVTKNRTSKYRKQKLTELKRETDKFIIVVDFKTPSSIIERTSRQKISKKG